MAEEITTQEKAINEVNKKKPVWVYGGGIVIILLIIGSILFLLLSRFSYKSYDRVAKTTNVSTVSKNAPLPEINTIQITAKGFEPARVTVKKGSALRWINDTGMDEVSVNSDDYPTNRLYPELNLGKVSKGSTAVHIFTKPGVYTYHNQFNPKQTGQINVN